MADRWVLGEAAALDDYIPNAPTNILGNAAQGVRDWYTNQPSWLDRARAENQRTTEAFQRGGMSEIAKQLATDTTEPQDLYGAFGVGNIKGVRPPLAPGALAATSEYRPPFYSAVEQAVQGAKQNAAPGQQWAGFLRNQPGVKQEEVQALGLGKLFEQPSVSKEAMLGEIAANRVNVGEVVKGSGRDSGAIQRAKEAKEKFTEFARPLAEKYGINEEHNLAMYSSLKKMDPTEVANYEALQRNWMAAERAVEKPETKFQQYTLPGGENYREMLLTLPQKGEGKPRATAQQLAELSGDDWATLGPNGRQRYQDQARQHGTTGEFRSSHYDEPNILAHVRYNDRVIDGKKTLFVEEVQSDWHQAGKRRGYKPGGPLSDEDVRAFHDLSPEVWRSASQDERVQLRHEAAQHGEAGVPDAPFKTTWPELAMKRIIREAAEKGYDKVAWTPGSVQAERYDLSKHIDMLKWYRDGDGYRVSASKDGNFVLQKSSMSERELADTVGKDMAEKIAKNQEQHGSMTGLDLKVGGEGMKGFYDEILPATVNKLVKKHGGKVGAGRLPGETTMSKAEQSELASLETGFSDVLLRRRPSFSREEEERYRYLLRRGGQFDDAGKEVHTLDITPSLRAAAMKGFPLFTAGGVAATGIMGEMARQDEYR